MLLKGWKKLRYWWKSILIVDRWNIYKTYVELIWITNFKESYNFLLKIFDILTNWTNKLTKQNIYVFVWEDKNIVWSVLFIKKLKEYLWEQNVFTKPVKFYKQKDWNIKRKADFDAEIWCFLCENKNKFTTFIILSSDGDFANIYEKLLSMKKQVIVFHWITREKIYKNWKWKIKEKNNLWKEIWKLYSKYKPSILTFSLKQLI